jgi:2-keto-3-deoxy-L-rhamnonate aldolase RhmA
MSSVGGGSYIMPEIYGQYPNTPSNYGTRGEIVAVEDGAGFDWLLLDGEHSPLDLRTMLAQLQSVAPSPVHLKRGQGSESGLTR